MYDMMKKQNFGVEIELTGITREQAANVIATYFGTQVSYLGTYYKTYGATDRKGRTWKAMSDGSIHTERKTNSGRIAAGRDYSCEVVSPVLQYEDMEDLQNVVRALREAGAIANSSCGIHVHVDGKDHTPANLAGLSIWRCQLEIVTAGTTAFATRLFAILGQEMRGLCPSSTPLPAAYFCHAVNLVRPIIARYIPPILVGHTVTVRSNAKPQTQGFPSTYHGLPLYVRVSLISSYGKLS